MVDGGLTEIRVRSKKEKHMSNKVKNMQADRQAPKDVPTPLKKQEPTASIWQEGGKKSPEEALAKDKADVRKPVGPGNTTAPGT